MTEKQPKEYIIIEKELKDLVAFRMPAYTSQVFVIESNVRSRPVSTRQVPDSTHLIEMANTEWKNREDWCSGWIDGFLSIDKPDWSKELDSQQPAPQFQPICVDKPCIGLIDVCPVIDECDTVKECRAHNKFLRENPDVLKKNASVGEYASQLKKHDAAIAAA